MYKKERHLSICCEYDRKIRMAHFISQSKKQSTKITVNLGYAFGHFDNLCLISADKIKTIGRPNTERCYRTDREQIT
jgi:hypothetical protein